MAKYQPLSDQSNSDGDEEENSALLEPPMPPIVKPKPANLLEWILHCPSKLILLLLLAIFVALYLFSTLEVSFFDRLNNWSLSVQLKNRNLYKIPKVKGMFALIAEVKP